MFVCVCHAISDREINEARQAGVTGQEKLFEHFGVEVNCGRCVKAISELLDGQEKKADDGICTNHNCKLDDTTDDVA